DERERVANSKIAGAAPGSIVAIIITTHMAKMTANPLLQTSGVPEPPPAPAMPAAPPDPQLAPLIPAMPVRLRAPSPPPLILVGPAAPSLPPLISDMPAGPLDPLLPPPMSMPAPVSSQDQASATVTARLTRTTARSRRANHSASVLIDDAGMAQTE